MHTAAGLLGLHERTHRALGRLLDHCEELSPEEPARPLDGFRLPLL